MKLSLIAAIGTNNALGKDNRLLWNMPRDMKFFRDTTKGKTIIMGRKTFESLARPLPNRRNIVITRDPNYWQSGIEVVHSLEEALRLVSLEHGKEFEENQEDVEAFVIGGGEIYKQAIVLADKLYITRIDDTPEADAFFPEIPLSGWEITSRIHYEADEENPFPHTFITYEKKR